MTLSPPLYEVLPEQPKIFKLELFIVLLCTLKSCFDKAVFLHTYVHAKQLVKVSPLN